MVRKETVTKIIDGDTIETSVRKKPVRIEINYEYHCKVAGWKHRGL